MQLADAVNKIEDQTELCLSKDQLINIHYRMSQNWMKHEMGRKNNR
jgi:hypothetical protein